MRLVLAWSMGTGIPHAKIIPKADPIFMDGISVHPGLVDSLRSHAPVPPSVFHGVENRRKSFPCPRLDVVYRLFALTAGRLK